MCRYTAMKSEICRSIILPITFSKENGLRAIAIPNAVPEPKNLDLGPLYLFEIYGVSSKD